MSEFFTSEFFAGNRERLRQLFTGTAPIVVTANGLLQRNGDNTYRFRQDSSFWYLTGIEFPDVILVMEKDKEYLIVPERDYFREAFDGAIETDEISRISGIQSVLIDTDGWRQLGNRLKRARHVATLGPAPVYAKWHGFYSNPARTNLISKIQQYNSDIEILDLREHILSLRVIKQTPELAAIQRAIDVTISGLKYVMSPSRLSKYATENEIEADLTRSFRREGFRHTFDPIIASGPRACRMHYLENDGVLSADELLMFDVGAEVNNYSADIARTISIGTPSKRQQNVHKAVLDAQEYAFSLIKKDADYRDYESAMELFLGEKMRELGLINNIDQENVRHYFPHRTSHFLGLDPHDSGDYEQPLQPGMVLTVEPGIYIPEEGIGVRIEDDVLVTEKGIKVLSSALPRELA